jgi:hydrogenase maturation protease
MKERVLVAGFGNDFRGDDAAGLLVCRMLREKSAARVRILEAGSPAAVLDLPAGYPRWILVDASSPRGAAGRIERFDAARAPLPRGSWRTSTHGWDLPGALAMARELKTLPDSVVVYAIEGKRFEPGASVSEEAARAVELAVGRILEETREEPR